MILRPARQSAILTSPLEGEVAASLRTRRVGGSVTPLVSLPPLPARKASPTSPSRGEVRRRRTARRGLSLLEVILALAILVLAMAAIGKLVDIGTDRGTDARVYSRGTRLAQAKMAEAEAGVIDLTGETEGQFTGDDGAWRYKVTAEAAGPPNLYTVTVRVTRDVSGRPVEVVLAQMLFDPTKIGSAAQAERPGTPDTTDTTGSGTGGTSP